MAVDNYSIWMVPKGDTGAKLQKEIELLAGQHGGPVFPPHVTLVPDIKGEREQVVDKTAQLATALQVRTVCVGVGVGGEGGRLEVRLPSPRAPARLLLLMGLWKGSPGRAFVL